MTLTEAGIHFSISIENLKFYEENGLLKCSCSKNGIPDYTEEDLGNVGLIQFLLKAGFDMDTLKQYFSLSAGSSAGTGNKSERIRLLRGQRYRLLDEIHKKQQSLDELDYMIEKIRKEQ